MSRQVTDGVFCGALHPPRCRASPLALGTFFHTDASVSYGPTGDDTCRSARRISPREHRVVVHARHVFRGYAMQRLRISKRYVIDATKPWHVAWWAEQLGVSEDSLLEAVDAVGNEARAVDFHLRLGKPREHGEANALDSRIRQLSSVKRYKSDFPPHCGVVDGTTAER